MLYRCKRCGLRMSGPNYYEYGLVTKMLCKECEDHMTQTWDEKLMDKHTELFLLDLKGKVSPVKIKKTLRR